MKNLSLPPAFSFFSIFGLALAFGLIAAPLAAQAQSAMETFNIGKITLVALFDHPAKQNIALFSSADPQIVNALVPSGEADSSVNAFLVQTDGKNVLIDTGLGGGLGGEIVHSLALLNISPADIDIILITHMHFDHIGGLLDNGKAVFPKAILKISNVEQAFFLAPNSVNARNNQFINFDAAKAVAAAYAGRLQGFDFGAEVAPGITAINAVGHTPGHTAFMLESQSRKLLVWGDTVHAIALQLPHPEISPVYDYDPEAAAFARKTILERVSTEHIPVAGMHIPFPGVGYVEKAAVGYSFKSGLN